MIVLGFLVDNPNEPKNHNKKKKKKYKYTHKKLGVKKDKQGNGKAYI